MPLNISNGMLDYDRNLTDSGQYPTDTRATLICEEGRLPSYNPVVTCSSHGHWYPTRLRCMGTNINMYI